MPYPIVSCHPKMDNRLTGILNLQEKHAQRILGGRLLGIQGQRAGQNVPRLLAVPNVEVGFPQMLERFRRVRVELDGTLQVTYRLRISLPLGVGEAKKMMGLGVLRVGFDDLGGDTSSVERPSELPSRL